MTQSKKSPLHTRWTNFGLALVLFTCGHIFWERPGRQTFILCVMMWPLVWDTARDNDGKSALVSWLIVSVWMRCLYFNISGCSMIIHRKSLKRRETAVKVVQVTKVLIKSDYTCVKNEKRKSFTYFPAWFSSSWWEACSEKLWGLKAAGFEVSGAAYSDNMVVLGLCKNTLEWYQLLKAWLDHYSVKG